MSAFPVTVMYPLPRVHQSLVVSLGKMLYSVAWGAGPRGSQNLVLVAKARALLLGRTAPIRDDLVGVATTFVERLIVRIHSKTSSMQIAANFSLYFGGGSIFSKRLFQMHRTIPFARSTASRISDSGHGAC